MDQTAIVCIEEAMTLGMAHRRQSFTTHRKQMDQTSKLSSAKWRGAAKNMLENGRVQLKMAIMKPERSRLWKARPVYFNAALRVKRRNKLGEDITVPRSAIPDVVQRLREISKE